jgi:vitamin B12 transporter
METAIQRRERVVIPLSRARKRGPGGEGLQRRPPRTLGWATLLGLTVALPCAGHAQRAPAASDTLPEYQLEGIMVTVGRSETARDALPRQIEVVTRTDLERTPAENVAELLKKQAALDVIQFPGLLAGVGIRGFRPQFSGIDQRTLVLIDGRPAGASNLALLELGGIERIELLKGPASSLYGSSAMGGVVNLVPVRSRGPVRSSATLGYGSWDTRLGSLVTGGSITRNLDFDLVLSVQEQGRDYRVGGGNLFRDWLGDTVAVRIFPDSTVLSPERGSGEVRPFTQYGTRSGHARLGYRLGGDWRLDWSGEALRADRVQTPGDLFSAWGDNRTLKNVARTSSDLALAGSLGRHSLSARVFGAEEEGENFATAEPATPEEQFVNLQTWNRWRGLQLQDVLQLGAHTLVAGLDYTRARADSERFSGPREPTTPWEPNSAIASSAAFAEGRVRLLDERLVASFGGRLDRIAFQVDATELWDGSLVSASTESFTVFNPSGGLQYTTRAGLRMHGTAGRAFVTPGAFNVAGHAERRPGDGTVHLTLGNRELRPENSRTWDAGIGIFNPAVGLDLDLTFFNTRVRDRITTQVTTPAAGTLAPDGTPIGSIVTYVNADEAEMRGVEIRAAYDLGTRSGARHVLRPYVTATRLLRAEETIAGATRDIRSVADLTVNYGLDFADLRRFSTRLAGRFVGGRADDDWNVWPAAELRYPRFMTLDWSADFRLARRLTLGLLVANLTDENYYEIRGYPLPGRSAQLRLSVDF